MWVRAPVKRVRCVCEKRAKIAAAGEKTGNRAAVLFLAVERVVGATNPPFQLAVSLKHCEKRAIMTLLVFQCCCATGR